MHILINVLGNLCLEDLVINVEKHLIEVNGFPVAAAINRVPEADLRPLLVASIVVRLGQGDKVRLCLLYTSDAADE